MMGALPLCQECAEFYKPWIFQALDRSRESRVMAFKIAGPNHKGLFCGGLLKVKYNLTFKVHDILFHFYIQI